MYSTAKVQQNTRIKYLLKLFLLLYGKYNDWYGNQHVVVFQDFLTKWPMAFPVPDQKAIRIAHLLADEVIPNIGVPEALLSDRGTNLLSHLMMDLCKLLGIIFKRS